MGTKKLVPLVWVTLLSACASHPSDSAEGDTEAFASRIIADKVAVAADAQREYVALIAEDKTVLQRKQAAMETDEVDVDYIGLPQELLQTFAYRYGYRYIESGKRVDLRIINVRVKKTPPIEVIRHIGYQMHSHAIIVMDNKNKTLRLVYKPLSVQGVKL